MKKSLILMLIFCLAAGGAMAGVVKSQKSRISFKTLGAFTTTTTDKVTADKKLTESDSEFKGKGILGSLASKTFLRSGKTGELVDLAAMTIAQIDHKRKEYAVVAVEKWAQDRRTAAGEGQTGQPAEKTESDIRIVRSEFKVTDTGEAKTFNAFDCRKYLALWTVDWENVKTGDKGTDRLETFVWTTPETDALKAAQAEEMAFYKTYLKAMGIDADKVQRDILGTEWIALLSGLDPLGGGSKMKPDAAKFAQEMGKIKGYSIVIDGKYFPAPKPKAAEPKEEGGVSSVGGALGKLGKGLLKKKADPAEENAPALAFYTEVLSLTSASVDAGELQVPANYKKK